MWADRFLYNASLQMLSPHVIQSFLLRVSQACCRAGSTLRGLPLRKSHNMARRSKPPVMQLDSSWPEKGSKDGGGGVRYLNVPGS